jgi:hypothetical protein
MPYKNYEILKISKEMMLDIYSITVQLSAFQKFEQGPFIKDTLNAIKRDESLGNQYNCEFIKFLVKAHSSAFQNIGKLEDLFERGGFTDENLYIALKSKLESLVIMLQGFRQSAEPELTGSA